MIQVVWGLTMVCEPCFTKIYPNKLLRRVLDGAKFPCGFCGQKHMNGVRVRTYVVVDKEHVA